MWMVPCDSQYREPVLYIWHEDAYNIILLFQPLSTCEGFFMTSNSQPNVSIWTDLWKELNLETMQDEQLQIF